MDLKELPVAVIGAGPIGLAAAAHLDEHGLESLVLERGRGPASGVAEWGHVRLFSPWRLNIDDAGRRILERDGRWAPPEADAHPLGSELRTDYLLPLAEALAGTSARLSFASRVVSVTRLGRDKTQDDREVAPFELTLERAGRRERLLARAVIEASGSWHSPNPLGIAGTPVPGERELGERIAYGIPDVLAADRDRYAGRRTLVIGAGHSAMNVIGDLSRLASEAPGTRFSWAIRRPASSVREARNGADPLPARAALMTRARELVESRAVELLPELRIEALRRSGDSVIVAHGRGRLEVDEIVAATGVRPDLDSLRELRLELDPALEAPVRLAPLIDPRTHSCGTVPFHGVAELSHPERDFYLAGMKSFGRAPTFLMTTGYEQVRSIAAELAGGAVPALVGAVPAANACATGPAQLGAGSCCGTGCA